MKITLPSANGRERVQHGSQSEIDLGTDQQSIELKIFRYFLFYLKNLEIIQKNKFLRPAHIIFTAFYYSL